MSGWEGFTRELLVERSKANPKPLVFAMLTNGDLGIQLAHGFGILALESDQHPSNGLIGCFIGDRVITNFQGETIVQEPQFVTLMHTDMIEGITTKPAADGAIKKLGMNGGLLKGSPKASSTVVPAFFPLPLTWVPYFLEKNRSNTEAQHGSTTTQHHHDNVGGTVGGTPSQRRSTDTAEGSTT
jgi:hypothetical protein